MATPAKFTLKNINALQLTTSTASVTGVCITPTTGGMSVDGNVDIGGGLSVTGLGHFIGGVSISGGASIGPLFIGDTITGADTPGNVLIISGDGGVIGTSAFPAGGGGGGTTNPAGSNTQIQYNNSNAFGADASFTWTEGTSTLGVSGSISVLGGPITLDTVGGVSSVRIQDDTANTGGEIILYSNPGGTANEAIRLETADNIVGTGPALILTNSGNTSSDVELHASGPTFEEGELLMFTKEIGGTSTISVNIRAGKTGGVANRAGGILQLNRLDTTGSGTCEQIITLDSVTQEIYINNTTGVSTVVLDSTNNPGRLRLRNSGGNIDIITLNGAGDNIVFQNAGGVSQAFGMSASQSEDGVRFILPITNGSDGQVLQTDGAGNLTYTNTSGFGVSELGELSDVTADTTNLIMGPFPKTAVTGDNNTAVGISALYDIGSGTSNTVVGYNAGESLTTGSANVAIGDDSLVTESAGIGSVAVGYNTLSSQTNATTENAYNTAIGWGAGRGLTSGTSSTFIGACAGGTIAFTGTNITCLGFGSQPSLPGVSNEITLGNIQIQNLRCADQNIASLSDARDKNDIRDLSYGLNFLENVRPVEFTWDRRVLTPDDNNDPKQGKRRAGFIAQELQEAMPNGENDILDLVYTSNPQRLEAKYGNLIPVMVKAIQDLKQEVDTIKEHLNLE